MSLKRINLNLDEKLLFELDTYAKEMYITRSAAISVLLSEIFYERKKIRDKKNNNI